MDKLRASRVQYKLKRLNDSRVGNWQTIAEIIQDPSLLGVIGKLSSEIYNMIARGGYQEVARSLFGALSAVPHAIFVHESIITGVERMRQHPLQLDDEAYYVEMRRLGYFTPPTTDVRESVNHLFEELGVNIIPYETNAELSLLVDAFIDDNERNLLFRIYVPSGRLYAAEADKLLSLFQDWLSRVGRHKVRCDGYRTSAGEVYEFFGDDSLDRRELSQELNGFSQFLDLCAKDTSAAVAQLSDKGLDRNSASALVARYSKEVRRLYLDLKQERESRMLAIQHQLESELIDTEDELVLNQIGSLIQTLVPAVNDFTPIHVLTPVPPGTAHGMSVTVNINQQTVKKVENAVFQNIQGSANLDSISKELLRLINLFGGDEAPTLDSAMHELEDPEARNIDRLKAKQRLKRFLLQLGGKVEDATLTVMQRYIENKLGI